MPNLSPTFLKLLEESKKKYGERMFRQVNTETKISRIPTGFFQLDRLLGGGVAAGRITEIVGHRDSMKSTMALCVVRSYLERCAQCLSYQEICQCPDGPETKVAVYVDVEHAIEEKHILDFGIDPGQLFLVQPPYGEIACEYAESLAAMPDVGLIIVDSLAALTPSGELLEGPTNKKGYLDGVTLGIRARLIARMCRAMVTCIDPPKKTHPKTAVMINHLLLKIGPFPVNIAPGGESQEYYATTIMRLWPLKDKKLMLDSKGRKGKSDNDDDDDIPSPEGEETMPLPTMGLGFFLEKHKIGKKHIGGEIRIILENREGQCRFADPADEYDGVLMWAKKLGLVENTPGTWRIQGTDTKFLAQKEVYAYWREHKNEYELMKQRIILAGDGIPYL